MEKTLNELHSIISSGKLKLEALDEKDWSYQIASDKWTRKEILGHLIDSAANNHQRFVRAQYTENLNFIYDQNQWVKIQNYKNEKTKDLVELWYFYNLHLLFVLKDLPKENYSKSVIIKNESVTLEWITTDYIRHLKHHLNQIIRD